MQDTEFGDSAHQDARVLLRVLDANQDPERVLDPNTHTWGYSYSISAHIPENPPVHELCRGLFKFYKTAKFIEIVHPDHPCLQP
jgi:hypothetical protein